MTDLLLLSGGIDSTALAVLCRPNVALTVDYGQRAASGEISAARSICVELGLRHDIAHIPIGALGSGLMTGTESSPLSEHPEFWPFRNQFLLTIGAMYAVRHGLTRVLIGTVATDVRHHDGSAVFLQRASDLIREQEGGIEVLAPGLDQDSTALVRRAQVPPSVLGWTHSCHVSPLSCGQCPGCIKHSNLMEELNWNR
ncbi:7-cyano-7-deazaguanine synthase [Lysobacter capsici]|uniref:7-cyano-7-deazaguanine synthase n=1 Tax=Lysobacter capsici TaxID=435897 RepID=UPI0009E80BA5